MSASPTVERTALVVDDEADILDILDEMLREEGWRTRCFSLGQPALAAQAEQRFDLLIVDVGLPDMNGLRIAMAVRERYDDDVVILVITGDDRRARAVGAYTVGADDFVGKPFDVDQLMARINANFARVLASR